MVSSANAQWTSPISDSHSLYSESGWPHGHILADEQSIYAGSEFQLQQYLSRTSSHIVGRRWFIETKNLDLVKGSQDVERTLFLPNLGIYGEVRNIQISEVEGLSTYNGEVVYERIDLPSEPCFQVGYFGLTQSANGLSGFITTPDGGYSISSFNPGVSVMYEAIANIESEGECSSCDIGHQLNSPKRMDPLNLFKTEGDFLLDLNFSDQESLLSSNEICLVDVAVVLTPEAALETNPLATAANAIGTMNAALFSSEVRNLRYRLVAVEVLEDLSIPNGSDPDDATDIIQDSDVVDEEIGDIRLASGADQILVVAQAAAMTRTFGVSELNDGPALRDLTLTLANTEWRFTAQHEWAHNHGCKHWDDNRSGTVANLNLSARAHRITAAQSTVLGPAAALGNTPFRVPFFSNPDVVSPAGVTGTIDRNNAEQLTSTACDVSDLHGVDGRDWSGAIVRLTQMSNCGGDRATWEVSFNDCEATSVSWSWSVNGDPFTFIGGGLSVGRTLPSGPAIVEIRATITCVGFDQPLVVTNSHLVDDCIDPCDDYVFYMQSPQSNSELSAIMVSSDQARLTWISSPEVEPNSTRLVLISDVLGRSVGRVLDQGPGWANISGLETGTIYFVTVKEGGAVVQTTMVLR